MLQLDIATEEKASEVGGISNRADKKEKKQFDLFCNLLNYKQLVLYYPCDCDRAVPPEPQKSSRRK